jgi:glycosyltransferase involved in cell wall biosynthesis
MHIISPLSWRGGEQQAVYLYEELDKLGVHQVFVCPAGSITESYCKKNGFHYRALKKRSPIDFIFAKQMRNICEEENINLMHPHDSHAHTFSILSKVFYKNPADIILERRVDFPISKNWFSRFKYNHPSIKKILCVSKAIVEVMRPDIKDPDKMQVIYEGIDLTKFDGGAQGILRQEYSIPQERPIIANVAALAQQKDYFTFIDTVELLKREGVEACFMGIGDGPQKAEILAYAQQKNLDQDIIFTGFRTDIPHILPEVDILLFSSETEGLGTTILDAYAAGVPIVTTNAGGIPELIKHNETAYLGEVKNPTSLANGVLSILRNPALADKFRVNGKKHVQQYSNTATALKTLDVYKAVLA